MVIRFLSQAESSSETIASVASGVMRSGVLRWRHPPPGLEAHVVKAEESSVLDEPACARIEAAGVRTGRVHLHWVAGGHWVNADNPDTLVGLLETELP